MHGVNDLGGTFSRTQHCTRAAGDADQEAHARNID
jgi:hypothetical protein